MEQKLANSLHLTINEKKFIETALLSEIRVDGRRPFDYRKLTIKFGRQLNSFPLAHSILFGAVHLCFNLNAAKCLCWTLQGGWFV